MLEYSEPVRPQIGKNTQADFNEGWTMVRRITAIEAPVWSPGALSKSPAMLANSFKANCRVIAMRVWFNVTARAPVLIVVAESPSGPQIPDNREAVPCSQLEIAFHGTLTTSGRQCVNFNPITGVADATTWYACSAFADGTGHPFQSVVVIPTAAAAPGYEKVFVLDTLGRTIFYPYVTDLDTVTAIIVGMKRVE